MPNTILICLVLIMVAACADPHAFMPMPYKPGNKGQNRMAQMILPDHIVVPLVRGMDEKTATLFTRAVIDAFLQKETIATLSRPTGRTSSLYSEIVTQQSGTTLIRWTFRGPYGETLDDFETPLETDPGGLDPSSLPARLLARDLAGKVTTRVLGLRFPAQAPDYEQMSDPTGRGEKIIVTAIFDAPGDGDRLLHREITRSLTRTGFKMTDRPDKKTYRLQCTVGITESRPGFVHLALTWELKSPQGDVLATIDQKNEIPEATLDGDWTELAPLVTQGAATGIANFFQNRRRGSRSGIKDKSG